MAPNSNPCCSFSESGHSLFHSFCWRLAWPQWWGASCSGPAKGRAVKEERDKDREFRVHSVEDPESPVWTTTEVSPSNRRKKPHVRFPFSAKGELAVMLKERGWMERESGWCHLATTVLNQGKCQSPKAYSSQTCSWSPLSQACQGRARGTNPSCTDPEISAMDTRLADTTVQSS